MAGIVILWSGPSRVANVSRSEIPKGQDHRFLMIAAEPRAKREARWAGGLGACPQGFMEGKGTEMKKQWGPFTIATGKDAKGKPADFQPLTDDQKRAMMRSIDALQIEACTKPSSKAGQEIYWSRVGVVGLPFAIFDSCVDWLACNEVWYSETGTRVVKRNVRID